MSKQCLKCGLILPDNANFCRGCGSSEFKNYNTETPPIAPIENPAPQPPKKSKNGLIIGIVAAIILVAVIAGVAAFAFFGNSKEEAKNNKSTTTTSTVQEAIGTTAPTSDTTTASDTADTTSASSVNSSADTSSASSEKPSSSAKPTQGSTKPSATIPSIKPNEGNQSSSEDDLLEEGTTSSKTTLCDDIIGNSIKNKKFTISMTLIADGEEIPTTITMNGSDLATKINVSGMDARMIIKDGKTYMAFDSFKMYMEMEDEALDIEDFTPDINSSGTYIGTTTVQDGGKAYTCETYKTASGATVKYYFLGNKWVRYESIDGSYITVFEIDEFKASTDTSLFNLSGYTKIDADSLNSMA